MHGKDEARSPRTNHAPRRRSALALLIACACAGAAACGGTSSGRSRASAGGEAGGDAPAAGGDAAPGAAPERPAGPMTLVEAQHYMLALVNRDRAALGLGPVKWDETAARAGRVHADDMARAGFTGHFGTDGSVPELRYTAAGGDGLVMENAGCFGDAVERELDPDPRFSAESLEKVQTTFMAEKPPSDGHRRNILTPQHTSLGVGLAKAKEIDVACVAQEFVDDYGRYEAVPKQAKVGDTIRIAGEISAPAEIAGVGLSRSEPGKPRKAAELIRLGGYPIPAPFVMYFPKGFKTPKPLEVAGNQFHISVPLSDAGRPGMYGVSVWAILPGSKELKMVSLRTILVEKGGRK